MNRYFNRYIFLHIEMVPVLALALTIWAGTAISAPITFNTALPVAEDEFIFRGQQVLKQSGKDPSGADRNMQVLSTVGAVGYGINSDLAIFGVIPYLDKRLKMTGSVERKTSGLGDISLFGRYTLYKDNFPGGNFRIAPFLGTELPTGTNTESDSTGLLPATVQLGSGSWDPFGGIVATYQKLDYQIDVQASYKVNTEADGFEFGDEAHLDGSFQYRLWSRKLNGGVPGFLYGIMEANLSYQDQNQSSGVEDSNSNGTRLFLVPGLQYITKRWILETAIQLPVIQDLNGIQLENDYIVSDRK